jgi:hypothetical protein
MRKFLLFLLFIPLAGIAQSLNENIITIIPTRNSSGVPTAVGKIVYRDLTTPTANTVTVSSPSTVTASYPLVWPATLSVGCLNVSNATTGQLTIAACSGGGSTPPFVDTTIITQNAADPTKQQKFDDSAITTGTTRTFTWQDANYIVAGTNISNSFTNNQVFGNDIVMTGPGGGSAGSIDFDNPSPGIGAIKFTIPNTGGSIYQFTLPPNGGTNHYVLWTDGAGTTNWAAVTSLFGAPFTLTNGAPSSFTIEGLASGSGSSAIVGQTSGGSGFGGNFTASGSGDIALFAGVGGSATTAAEFSGNVLFNNGSTTGMEYLYATKTLQLSDSSGSANVIAFNTGSGTFAQLTGNGFSTSGILTLSAMTGTSCLEEIAGVVTATGSTCAGSGVTSVTGTSPISSSGGTTPAISCSTCLVTGGGQTITGSDTFSAAQIFSGGIGSDLIPNLNNTYKLGGRTANYWTEADINNLFIFTNINVQTGALFMNYGTSGPGVQVIDSSGDWVGPNVGTTGTHVTQAYITTLGSSSNPVTTATFTNATVGSISGSTQCVEANSSGVLAGFGAPCLAAPTAWSTWTPTVSSGCSSSSLTYARFQAVGHIVSWTAAFSCTVASGSIFLSPPIAISTSGAAYYGPATTFTGSTGTVCVSNTFFTAGLVLGCAVAPTTGLTYTVVMSGTYEAN